MIRGIPNISMLNIAYQTNHAGKMSFPVDSASLIYSHFEHVSGIAAPKGSRGVSISKLDLLDTLIGNLNQAKKNSVPPTQPVSAGRLDAGHLDALIESYRNQIAEARAASLAMPYIPSPRVQSGALFSIVI